jgi:hypothetical protein
MRIIKPQKKLRNKRNSQVKEHIINVYFYMFEIPLFLYVKIPPRFVSQTVENVFPPLTSNFEMFMFLDSVLYIGYRICDLPSYIICLFTNTVEKS